MNANAADGRRKRTRAQLALTAWVDQGLPVLCSVSSLEDWQDDSTRAGV